MRTKIDVINEAVKGFQHSAIPLDNVSASRYFDVVHREVCIQLPVYASTVTFDALVVGTSTYALGETVVDVKGVYYHTSASSRGVKLCAFDPNYQDHHWDQWREHDNATPRSYCIEGTNLRLDPPPSVASTGSPGYPMVKAYVYLCTALTHQDELPSSLRSDEVYVYGIRLKHAISIADEKAIMMYRQLYTEEFNALDRYYVQRASEVDRSPEPTSFEEYGVEVI